MLRVWYSDSNALARLKLRAGITELIGPLLAEVIRQGEREGVITTPHPEQSARVVVSVLQDLMDCLAELFFAVEAGRADPHSATRIVAAHSVAVERILGLSTGSVELVDKAVLRQWFKPASKRKEAS